MGRGHQRYSVIPAWVALQRQKRRRKGGSPLVVPAPVIMSGALVISEVNPAWLDAIVDFTFNGTGLPAGQLEVQGLLGSHPGNWEARLMVAIGATQFRDDMVFTGQDDITYRMRYVSGAITGPWSGEYLVTL